MNLPQFSMAGLSQLLDSKLDSFLKKKVIPAIKNLLEPLIAPIQEENRSLKTELADLRREMKESMLDHDEDFERQRAECDDEARKANLVFHGLDRSKPALSTVADYINNRLDSPVEPAEILSAEHIGGQNTIVVFQDPSKKKEVVYALKDKEGAAEKKVTVKCDYSPRSRSARSQLFSLYLDQKNSGCSPRLLGGKVTVGDTEFLLHERRGCVEKKVRGRREEFLPLPPPQTDRQHRGHTPRRSRVDPAPRDTQPQTPSPTNSSPKPEGTPEEKEEMARRIRKIFAEATEEHLSLIHI